MASAITKKQQESIYDVLNKRFKGLLTEEVLSASSFAKELYKTVRSKVKKLDEIKFIEELVKSDVKINECQAEKFKNKEALIQSVQLSLEAFEIYKKTEYVTLMLNKKFIEEQLAQAEAQVAAIIEECKSEIAADVA